MKEFVFRFAVTLVVISFCFLPCWANLSSYEDAGDFLLANENGTTSNNTSKCGEKASCGDCTKLDDCVWCESKGVCQSGHFYGSSDSCSDWRWKQCEVKGLYTLLGFGGLIGLVLLCCVILVCCCCCRKGKSSKSKRLSDYNEFKLQSQYEEQEALISKTPKTDQRRAELVEKYGSALSKKSTRTSDI
mmetsp:Transcript_20448/g.28675  ORF Transcript_20448/g.28675 Transcript_20448/m.28675 type:complete len:188 (-) Transcript_20448:63-626(-)